MRILHTADWHLGATLHELSREAEHAAFLDWLLATIAAERVDALLIAGDLFDHGNPSSASQRLWYHFAAEARRRFPGLDVVAVGGNHDSAARLEAPVPLLDELGVTVVGAYPWGGSDDEVARLVVPLGARRGTVEAWVAAVPYLRPVGVADRPAEVGPDPLIEAVRGAYARVIGLARQRREPGQAVVAMGHGYLVGGVLSELSEHKVLGGNQHPLPVDLFPDDVAYVALGHLHLPQTVAGREHVRYAGSPLPLSVSEAGYRNQVVLVEVQDGVVTEVRPLVVPRSVGMRRVSPVGSVEAAWPRARVLEALAALPARDGAGASETWPYLDVAVDVSAGPDPDVRAAVEGALADRAARLVRLALVRTHETEGGTPPTPPPPVSELQPEEVFVLRYQSTYPTKPAPELLAAFHDLLGEVTREEVGA